MDNYYWTLKMNYVYDGLPFGCIDFHINERGLVFAFDEERRLMFCSMSGKHMIHFLKELEEGKYSRKEGTANGV